MMPPFSHNPKRSTRGFAWGHMPRLPDYLMEDMAVSMSQAIRPDAAPSLGQVGSLPSTRRQAHEKDGAAALVAVAGEDLAAMGLDDLL